MNTSVITMLSAVSAGVLAVTAPADAAEEITVTGAVAHGTGCISSTVDVALSDGSTALVSAPVRSATGVGSIAAPIRQQCAVALSVATPAGTTWQVVGVTVRGTASIAAGAGVATATVYAADSRPDSATATAPLQGPTSGDFSADAVLPPGRPIRGGCGAPTRLKLDYVLMGVSDDPSRPLTVALPGPNTTARLKAVACG
ncbi:MAG TPA: DUF4360 domain-containing protein [Pilimelia sp.]|nr:DUF4360 domain-containing protein [Pilimelia sp.]